MSGLQGDNTGNPLDDFDLGFETESNPQYEDRHTEILPESQYLDQQRIHNSIHGSQAEIFSGRLSSPKLFAQQSLFPQVTQLRCWKIENGTPSGIGVIDANASEEDFVKTFLGAMPKPGEGKFKFKLRPLDIDGRELGQEITLVISEHHTALAFKPSAEQSNISAHQAEQQTMQSVISMLKETLLYSQSALQQERVRTQTLLEQMAQERIDLASNAASGVQVISERMMDADTKRHEVMLKQEQQRNQQAQDNMSTFFSSQSEMQLSERQRQQENYERQREREQMYNDRLQQMEESRREREKVEQSATRERDVTQFQMLLEQERARREREQQEFRERMEIQRQEWEMKKRQESEEYERKEQTRKAELHERERRLSLELKEKESERLRQHEMRLKELEIAAQRDREHSERMMQLQALQVQNEKQGSFKETLKEGMETLTGLGIDPMELATKLFGGGNDGGNAESIIGALTSVAGKVADVVQENVRTQGTIAESQAHVQAAQAALQMPQPPYGMVPYGNPQGMPPQGMPPQGMYAQGMPPEQEFQEENQMLDPVMSYSDKVEAPKPPVVEINLPLKVQKLARKALRFLAATLPTKEPHEWEETISVALVSEPSIYHYCQAVGVRPSLKEAGCSPELSQSIIKVLQTSSLVPNDLNYGGF